MIYREVWGHMKVEIDFTRYLTIVAQEVVFDFKEKCGDI